MLPNTFPSTEAEGTIGNSQPLYNRKYITEGHKAPHTHNTYTQTHLGETSRLLATCLCCERVERTEYGVFVEAMVVIL